MTIPMKGDFAQYRIQRPKETILEVEKHIENHYYPTNLEF